MINAVKKMLGGKGHVDVKAILDATELGEMELCQFDFYPWSRKIEPHYETVKVTHISVYEKGVYAKFKSELCNGEYGCFVGHLDGSGHAGWTGIFNTRSEAEECFLETMAKWKANIPG